MAWKSENNTHVFVMLRSILMNKNFSCLDFAELCFFNQLPSHCLFWPECHILQFRRRNILCLDETWTHKIVIVVLYDGVASVFFSLLHTIDCRRRRATATTTTITLLSRIQFIQHFNSNSPVAFTSCVPSFGLFALFSRSCFSASIVYKCTCPTTRTQNIKVKKERRSDRGRSKHTYSHRHNDSRENVFGTVRFDE